MIRPYCPSQYISATDVGTTELDMAVFAHEIGDMQACAGKPAELGRIPHELGSTGYGVSVAFKASLELLKGSKPISFNNNISISHNKNGYEKELRVTIQGFGSVGSFTAKFLDELVAGIKIVGISDVSGFIYNKDGLNIPRLMLDMRGKAKLSDLPKSEKVDNKTIPDSHSSYNILDKDDIFEVDSDVFIPVAMSGVINDKTAPKLLEHGKDYC